MVSSYSEMPDAPDIPNEDLRALHALWLPKKGERPMPGRADLDPGEIPGRHRDYVLGLYERMVARRCPIYSENAFKLIGRVYPKVTRRLCLPLSRDGVNVDMALVGHLFEYDGSRRAVVWRTPTMQVIQELPAGNPDR